MKTYKGSISIYFTFSIVLIISVILSVTELARYNCQKLYLTIETDSGLDSMLSLYHRKLYEYYNIYGVEYRDDDLLTKEYLHYIEPYYVGNFYKATITYENCNLKHDALIDKTFFEKEILEYMRYALIGKTIEYFGKEINISDKVDIEKLLTGIKDVYEETKKSDIYSELYNKYFDFKSDIKALEVYGKKIKTHIKNANLDIQDLRNISTSGTLSNGKSVKNKINSLKTNFENIKSNINNMENKMKDFMHVIEINESKYKIDKASGIYDLSEDVCEFIEDEFDTFRGFVNDSSNMHIELQNKKEETNEVTNGFLDIVAGIDEYIENLTSIENDIKEAKRQKGDDYDKDLVKDLNNEKKYLEDDFSDYLKEIRNEVKNINISDINLDLSSANHDEDETTIEKLLSITNSSFLNLVLDTEKLNSITNESVYYKTYHILSNNQTLSIDKAILSEYALDKFNYYDKEINNESTKSNSKVLEVERLISGGSSDLDNFKRVVNDIFKIRLAMNVLYIYKNSTMRNEARTFAYTVFGGFSRLLAEVMFLSIITAWGSAQSIVDIKRLLKDKKVNFMHDSSSWGVSINNILDIARNGIGEVLDEDDEINPIRYKDYLRLLLINTRQSLINERMASIMEVNIRKEQDSFDFEKLLASFNVENKFNSKHFFTNFLFLKAKDIVLNNEYDIKISAYKSFID